jgi:hypothetical protein
LPDAESACVEERKVTGYLLALGHPDGHDKAVYFMGFGFRPEEWRVLAEALLDTQGRTVWWKRNRRRSAYDTR